MIKEIPLDLYDAHLELQAEISFSDELRFFSSLREWGSVTSVLDLGCGNGAYLVRLAEAFPNVRFLGIDFRKDAIELAEKMRPRENVDYHWGTVSSITDQFDALISRFCILYTDNKNEIANWVGEHVRSLILQIYNEDDSLETPPILERVRANWHVTRANDRDGRYRSASNDMEPLWSRVGFEPIHSDVLVVDNTSAARQIQFRELITLVTELGVGRPLPEQLRSDIDRWGLLGGHAQYAMRASWFQRCGVT